MRECGEAPGREVSKLTVGRRGILSRSVPLFLRSVADIPRSLRRSDRSQPLYQANGVGSNALAAAGEAETFFGGCFYADVIYAHTQRGSKPFAHDWDERRELRPLRQDR